jgi:aryl-alcohol dehydrogenase-like predicted oxidoreductase
VSTAQIELRPGYRISRLIKGGWQLAGDHGEVEPERAIADMSAFVDAGIITFDCADIYTGVETMIGAFLARYREQRGAQAAAAIKVHTKLVPDIDALRHVDRAYVERIVDRSRARLRLERLDLVQFHWWDYAAPGCSDALGHLEALRQAGKIDRIGTTNFDLEHLRELRETGVDIVSTQVQYSLLDARPAGAFANWCGANRVAILAYGALAGGFLTDAWLGQPDPGHRFANRSLIKYRLIIDEFGGWDLFQALLAALRQIADRHEVTIANVAARAMLDNPDVSAVILGARYAQHLPQNLKVLSFRLDQEDRVLLDAVLSQRRGPSGPVYDLERDRGGRHGRIMKYRLNATG